MGIMEPLPNKEHLQTRSIYEHTLSGIGTATGSWSNHFIWKIRFQWTNPRCIFIRQKYSFNETVQESWTARCEWIHCLKALLHTVAPLLELLFKLICKQNTRHTYTTGAR